MLASRLVLLLLLLLAWFALPAPPGVRPDGSVAAYEAGRASERAAMAGTALPSNTRGARQRPASAPRQSRAQPPHPIFRDVARTAGLTFSHTSGVSDERFLPEIMGSGVVFLDFDNDGWLDVFLVDGGSIADPAVAGRARHRLYRNRGDGTFGDVTAASGIRHSGYGMGACAGDFDNDGLIDLYITNVGPNVLYRNLGEGRFEEVRDAGGAGTALWSTSCAFVDVDRDGHLDLFVTNYVDAQDHRVCGSPGPPRLRDYCNPIIYPPLTSVLYRNTGRGTFEDVSERSGIADHRGNGLGVAVSDIDDDGWPDVFVANDGMPDFLFHNQQDGTFREIGILAGVSVAVDGRPRAGMGTAFGDFAGMGRPGVIVTNLDTEMHTIFLNEGDGLFSDVTIRSGIGPATLRHVGFGVAFLDYDNDTHLDIAIANGHIMVHAALLRAGTTFPQRNLLLRGSGGRFVDTRAGSGFALERVSRGLAIGDIDNDGDLDILITNVGSSPTLLLNDGGNRANSILVRVIGTKSNRSGIGARLVATTGDRRQVREVRSGSSYLSQNDLRAHFGLGEARRVDRLEIRWPSGMIDVADNLPVNHVFTVREGQGVIGHEAFAR